MKYSRFNLFVVWLIAMIFSGCSLGVSRARVPEVNMSSTVVESSNREAFPLPYDPHYVEAYDVNRWVIADDQKVWITSNGGHNWTNTFTAEEDESHGKELNRIRGISFVTDGKIFLVTNLELFKSLDFGRTWVSFSPLSFEANSIFFLNENVGWAVGRSGHNSEAGDIFRTADGGLTWSKCHITNSSEISAELGKWSLDDLFVLKSRHGIAVGDGLILITDDGGGTWKRSVAERYKYFKVERSKELAWALSVGNPVISITKDDGVHWKNVAVPFDNRDTVRFVSFFDDGRAFLGLNHLFRTEDGGRTWIPIDDAYFTYFVGKSTNGDLLRLVIKNEKSYAQLSVDNGLTWK